MKNIEHWVAQQLVEKFCANANWPKELKMAKKLLCKSPDLDAWLNLNIGRKINSLCFFLTTEGESYIPLSQKNPYLMDLGKLELSAGIKKSNIIPEII